MQSDTGEPQPDTPLGATFHYREIPKEEQKPLPAMGGWAVGMMGLSTFGSVSRQVQELMEQARAEDAGQPPPVSATFIQHTSQESLDAACLEALEEYRKAPPTDPKVLKSALEQMSQDIRFLLERAERQEAERRTAEEG